VLTDLLFEHPFADDEALLHTVERTVTAGAARDGARAVADELVSVGVRAGMPVLVQLVNDPDFVAALFGVWLAGGVFVPVNPRAPQLEVERISDAVRPAAVLSPAGVRVVDGDPAIHDPDTAFVMWTSGTTGEPKAILHTHTAYIELLDRVLGPLRGASGASGPAKRPTPNLIPVSLSLNAGLYNALFGLRAGASLVIMDGFDTATFADLVHRFEIRSTVLPPAAITMLNDDATIDSLTPLRYVRSITAPLSPLQARRFTERFGAFVLNGYGQAEIGEVIGWTAADAKAHPDKVGAVGRPHAGVDVKLVGPDGALWVRPPSMAAGYAGGGELADRVDGDGFVDTGDLARIDDDGFVWIEGRAGDVINRGGHKVFPEHVEEVLRLAPGVVDAAVVAAPDDRLGEVPVAYVVCTPGAVVDDAALEALCRDHLVAYKVPVAFERVDALPRNEAGKLLRAQIVVRWGDARSSWDPGG
jgi:acyl-CoA synthetase (AMP-forming)/AMP-acid ligase II